MAKHNAVRNQNSATLSSGKNNGGNLGPNNGASINVNGQYGGIGQQHATGSQRVRDKLLINSGGLALNQPPGQASRMLPVNGGGPNSA